jgi:hypothetical protein
MNIIEKLKSKKELIQRATERGLLSDFEIAYLKGRGVLLEEDP